MLASGSGGYGHFRMYSVYTIIYLSDQLVLYWALYVLDASSSAATKHTRSP